MNKNNNARHVEKVMRERGYLLWDDNVDIEKRNDKYSNKAIFRKALLFIVLPLSIIFIPLIISDYNASVARKKKEQGEQLSSCLALASNDYWISQEMKNAAGSNPELNLVLAKRHKAGIEAKLKCHEDYSSDNKNAINTLKAEKTETESWISLYESEIKSNNTSNNPQPSNHSSTYCTSQQIGTSIFTNCY